MLQMQIKLANAEEAKAAANMKNVDLTARNNQMKTEIESLKARSQDQIGFLEQQLKEAKVALDADKGNKDLEYKYWETRERLEVERERIAATERAAKRNNQQKASNSDD